ncbi:unnamed protein product [Urochloa decumbens]|uniref:BOP1 N-terminal domain-containing protein n=1 Tax=Urochloa decumbens TaxID=240449 RepID=A0ABC9GAG9_9POAL
MFSELLKVVPRNTVGEVPLEWYKDEEYIGYDIEGRKIKKRDREGGIEAYLRNADDAKNWRKIYDEYNGEEVQITKEEAKIISRLLKGKTPRANVDPYPDYVDWFEYEDNGHPLSSAPEPKRRFVPSKWEQKKVVKLVRAIRNGWIKFDKPKEESNLYLLWGDETDTADNKRQGLSYIPAPKPNLPGHEESYNPSVEYIPTQEEIDSYQLMYEEDRPKFISKRFESLPSVPAYEKALREGFDRCLDLYLCPRTRKKRVLPMAYSCCYCCREHDLLLINAGVGSEEVQMRAKELLQIGEMAPQEDGKKRAVRWIKHKKLDGITLIHHKIWLCQMWTGILREITSLQLCQVYDLQKAQLVKKLESGLREISSISIHPGGDNVIVGSKDGKLCWFDTDLSTRPYKTLKTHSKDEAASMNREVVGAMLDCKFHPKQPWLFTAGADSVIRLYCD